MLALPWERDQDQAATDAAEIDDLALVKQARTDRAAFGTLYDRYVDRIYAYCFRRLGTREAAEDATSQTFLKLLVALQRPPRDEGSVRAWIFTIAHRVMIDAHRSSRETAQILPDDALVSSQAGPEDVVFARMAGDELRELVRQLPTQQRDLIYLRLAGLSNEESARVLGISNGAVRVGQHRAIRRLRELYERQETRTGSES